MTLWLLEKACQLAGHKFVACEVQRSSSVGQLFFRRLQPMTPDATQVFPQPERSLASGELACLGLRFLATLARAWVPREFTHALGECGYGEIRGEIGRLLSMLVGRRQREETRHSCVAPHL